MNVFLIASLLSTFLLMAKRGQKLNRKTRGHSLRSKRFRGKFRSFGRGKFGARAKKSTFFALAPTFAQPKHRNLPWKRLLRRLRGHGCFRLLSKCTPDGGQNERNNRSEPWKERFCKSACAKCQRHIVSRSTVTYHTEEITLYIEIVRLYTSIRVDERDLSRMVTRAIYLSLTAVWQQISQTWFQKRSPSRNLGGIRSIRRSSATSWSTALNFLFLC